MRLRELGDIGLAGERIQHELSADVGARETTGRSLRHVPSVVKFEAAMARSYALAAPTESATRAPRAPSGLPELSVVS